jgi:hypothetical protein
LSSSGLASVFSASRSSSVFLTPKTFLTPTSNVVFEILGLVLVLAPSDLAPSLHLRIEAPALFLFSEVIPVSASSCCVTEWGVNFGTCQEVPYTSLLHSFEEFVEELVSSSLFRRALTGELCCDVFPCVAWLIRFRRTPKLLSCVVWCFRPFLRIFRTCEWYGWFVLCGSLHFCVYLMFPDFWLSSLWCVTPLAWLHWVSAVMHIVPVRILFLLSFLLR